MTVLRASLKTVWLYGLIGGIYICGNAWLHPQTLSTQLTHFTPWIHEDTFGVITFTASAIAFFALNLLEKKK